MNNDNRIRVRPSQTEADKIKILSAACLLCIIMGVASIAFQIAALVMSESLGYYDPYGFDVIGFGIWAGFLYLLAGSFGISTTYTRTKSRLMGTIVSSAFAIGASIVAATLSGMAASVGVYAQCYNSQKKELCDPWVILQWCLMGISVLASIGSIIVIILASEVICCSNYNLNRTVINQQEVNVGIRNTQQQPVYFKPQPMELNAQQLPTFQVSYVPQVIRQSQPAQLQPQVQLPYVGQGIGQSQPAQLQPQSQPQPQPQQQPVPTMAPVLHQQVQQQSQSASQ